MRQPSRRATFQRPPAEGPIAVTLTSRDLGRLHVALRVLLAAERYDHVNDWRAAVRRTLAPLLDSATRPPSASEKDVDVAREVAIVRLLRPVYRAGMRARRDSHRRQAMWGRVIERMTVGVATFDARGALQHENPALLRLLVGEPERERVCHELARVARLTLLPPGRGRRTVITRELRTPGNTYAISAVNAGATMTARTSSVTVFIERIPERGAPQPSRRHGLTPRERQVAGLLASGGSTSGVASALGISVHTVRRHAEQLLRKLGVHSRGAAVAKLRAE